HRGPSRWVPRPQADRARWYSQRTSGLQPSGRLGCEHRPGAWIDEWVEHVSEQDDAARERAHIGQPEGTRAVDPEQSPQRGLDRPQGMPEVQISVGDDVGGDRQREEEHPGQRPPTRKLVGSDQPGGPRTDNAGEYTDAEQEKEGVRARV